MNGNRGNNQEPPRIKRTSEILREHAKSRIVKKQDKDIKDMEENNKTLRRQVAEKDRQEVINNNEIQKLQQDRVADQEKMRKMEEINKTLQRQVAEKDRQEVINNNEIQKLQQDRVADQEKMRKMEVEIKKLKDNMAAWIENDGKYKPAATAYVELLKILAATAIDAGTAAAAIDAATAAAAAATAAAATAANAIVGAAAAAEDLVTKVPAPLISPAPGAGNANAQDDQQGAAGGMNP